jgi:outer membrane protein OmpA-like peptidoglycan-associated protein
MKFKKLLYTVLLFAGCMSASAQTPQTETVEEFNHHWFVQGQAGAQYTLGEICFGDLISPNVQVAGGYQFTPVWGLRLAVNAWQSKGGSTVGDAVYKWKWNYVAPTFDVTCDLVNLIWGYKPNRVFNAGILGGIGVNVAFKNDEAIAANGQIISDLRARAQAPSAGDVMYLDKLWGGTIARFMGRFGVYADFRVSKRVSLGLEVNANTTSDMYNSKDASNLDWYFNALGGVKVKLGKTTKMVEKKPCCVQEKVVEKIVEKIVEKPVEKIVYRDREIIKTEPLRKDIFFTISHSDVSRAEMVKVEDIAAYLNKYPQSKVTITGYADKGTGNAKINEKLAKKRSEIVADLLVNKFGIASSRITVESKGDTVQPYEQNDLNRVSICVAE